MSKIILVALGLASIVTAFTTSPTIPSRCSGPSHVAMHAEKENFFSKFMKEVDNFVDDAASRRLGNGAAFYGKRKSSFYGEMDSMKKADADVASEDEDYQGPTNAGYFVWRQNDEGRMQPQTRLKGKPLEKFVRKQD